MVLSPVIGSAGLILKLHFGWIIDPVRTMNYLGERAITEFEALIQNEGDGTSGLPIHIQIDGDRLRMWAGATRLGSWPLSDVSVERLTPFRFRMIIEGDAMIVTPDDPTGFTETTRAFVDARTPRFGLANRIRSQRDS